MFFIILLYKEKHHPISMVCYQYCVQLGWIAQSVSALTFDPLYCVCIKPYYNLMGSIPRRFNYVIFLNILFIY